MAAHEVGFVALRIVDLIDRYRAEQVPRLFRLGGLDQISVMRGLVQPHWDRRLVTEITSSDVERLLALTRVSSASFLSRVFGADVVDVATPFDIEV